MSTTWKSYDDGYRGIDTEQADIDLSRDAKDGSLSWSDGQYDTQAIEPQDLDQDDSLGGRIHKKDIAETNDPEKWERLRKYDQGRLKWRGDHEGDAHFDQRYMGQGQPTVGIDDLHYKVHRTATICQNLGVPSAVENEARTLVASLVGDGEGRGHLVEKQAIGAIVVVDDRHISAKVDRIHDDDAEIQQIQRALERADNPAERFRILGNLRAVTNDKRIRRALRSRLAERDDVKAVAEEYDFEIRHAVTNIDWGHD